MNCQTCLRLKGAARCEGCQRLFCITCLTEHQNDLEQKFSELIDERNRLVEMYDRTISTKIRRNFEKFSEDLRTKHKEKHFLENDLEEMRQRLENLREEIERTSSDTLLIEQPIQTSRTDVRKLVPELRQILQNENTRRPYRSAESIVVDKEIHLCKKKNEIDSQCRTSSNRTGHSLKIPTKSFCKHCCSIFMRTKSIPTCPFCRDILSLGFLVS